MIFSPARLPAYYESNMTDHDVTVRVRYAETDQMGVVYHSNYLIWFEVGRVEIMRSLGFDYKRMESEDDCYLVVADFTAGIIIRRATT